VDEVELSFFGPGFGECIVVHVGDGHWFVVDSCIDPSDKSDQRPVGERYLRSLGVPIETHVDPVVATHWHDDHVKGLSRLIDQARSAKVCCANVFTRDEFVKYVQTIRKGSAATAGGKVSEFARIIDLLSAGRRVSKKATAGRLIHRWQLGSNGIECDLISLSPSDRDLSAFFEAVALDTPTWLESKRSAVSNEPNLLSVVLHLRMPNFSVLLGADMEIVPEESRGWRAVFQEANDLGLPSASVIKVSHHGSKNGHFEDAWEHMIEAGAIGVVTPFNRLAAEKKLPTEDDIERLRVSVGRLFLTAPRIGKAARKDRDPTVKRGLRSANISMRDLDSPIGMVRLRRQFEADSWSAEVFAPAVEL
jgi:hypothetical protein